MRLLDLQPLGATVAGGVQAAHGLGHDPLVAEIEGACEKRQRLRLIGGHDLGHAALRRQRGFERPEPLRERLVDQFLAIEVQAVEVQVAHRQ